MKHTWLVAACILLIGACQSQPDNPTSQQGEDQNGQFVTLAEAYLKELTETVPEFATIIGIHDYDDRLNDYSAAGLARLNEMNHRFREQVAVCSPAKLSEVNRIDREILLHHIDSEIFAYESLQEWRNSPLKYNVGNAIYGLLARDFAPLEQRLNSVAARLAGVPALLDQARANLENPPRVFTETAIAQNKGTVNLVRAGLDEFLDQVPAMKAEMAPAREAAAIALEAYGTWLEEDLLPRSKGDFRLGEELFRKKLHFTLESDFSLETIASRAEAELAKTRALMYETALPLYRDWFPEGAVEDHAVVIKAVLDKLAEDRPSNETIVDLARRKTIDCTDFVRERQIVSVPEEPVKLIVMPEFLRGVSVAYCDSPGPYEENGETFYAIAPTPAHWSQERATSFFREYNNYMLDELTIHEAVPGHYLQMAHANKFKAPTKIRAIFSSGTFAEGWGCYAEDLMAEHGYGGPQVRMQQLKMHLRLIINALIDQGIHTADMTEEEAMKLMMEQGFQEEGEAAGKWVRACLTSTQLSTYFVGNLEIHALRKAYEAAQGLPETQRAMHDLMLSFGTPAPKYVKRLMGLE